MITCQFEDGASGTLRHASANNIVIQESKILLVKRADYLVEGGKWSLPGGFMNRDESASTNALRELEEETGWIGTIDKLFCIITYPFRLNEERQNVAFFFITTNKANSGHVDEESTDRKWFSADELDTITIAFDHYRVIKKYLMTKHDTSVYPLIIEKESDY